MSIKKLFRELYITGRFFLWMFLWISAFLFSFFIPVAFPFVTCAFFVFLIVFLVDLFFLFRYDTHVRRNVSGKFSNGDENPVGIEIKSRFPFKSSFRIVDEIPFQFQCRDIEIRGALESGEEKLLQYSLRPVRRGEYHFGKLHVFLSTPIGLSERRISRGDGEIVKVYPAYRFIKKYELQAFGSRWQSEGMQEKWKSGASMSFDQIKSYVPGDDPRTINWKATAKTAKLMVNTYMAERSQPVYCLIDKGRTMQSAFNGMTILDYAINATVALSDIILKKGDRLGLYTFSHVSGAFIKADHHYRQLFRVNEMLYNQTSHFLETDFEKVYAELKVHIPNRSMLVLFTNFDSLNGLKKQLPALVRLSRRHLLLVILFENTEVDDLLKNSPRNVRDFYYHTIASGFHQEKWQIVSLLRSYNINTILSIPEQLTVNSINAYLEVKKTFRY